MSAIVLAVFWVVVFPNEGKLVTVDQPNFTRKGRMESNESAVPLVDQVKPAAQILGAGMYASLMGTFDFPASINYLGSTSVGKSIAMVVNRTDPWVLPVITQKCTQVVGGTPRGNSKTTLGRY